MKSDEDFRRFSCSDAAGGEPLITALYTPGWKTLFTVSEVDWYVFRTRQKKAAGIFGDPSLNG